MLPRASVAAKELLQFLKSIKLLRAGRVLDALAIVVIVFVVWKLLVAPRSLRSSDAQPAPRVTLATLTGPPFALASHRGRVVFLDFWATWCEPCKLSLPMVERYARAHPEVDVVPVDVGEPRAVVSDFAAAYKLRHVALDDQHLAANWFGVNGYPTIVVIDPKGNIRASWPGFNPAVELNMAHAEAQLH